MNFYLIGIDYKRTTAEVRELAFKKRHQIESFCRYDLCSQATVLFTCNRVEIYGISEDTAESIDIFNIVRFIWADIFENAYFKENTYETTLHAFRLACGLESQIPFESQIAEQLRSWLKRNPMPRELKARWSFILKWADDIRALTGIDDLKKDIADFALEDIQNKIGSLKGKKLLIIGTGKVAELISQKNLDNTLLYFAARKKHARALKLARRSGGNLVSFDELSIMFNEADAVISATSSPHYVLKADAVSRLARERATPLYIYDLAVPKDVHPEVSMIDKVRVFDMRDMSLSLEAYRAELKPVIDKAGSLIENIALLLSGEENVKENKSRNKAELVGV